MTRRALFAAAVLAAVLAAAVVPVGAAEWLVDPVVTLGVQHWDNILLQSGTGSDDAGVLGLVLPITGTTPRAHFGFTWSPLYSRYREQTGLDSFSQTAGLNWTFQKSVRVNWMANAYYSRSDRLNLDYNNPSITTVAVARQRTTAASVDVGASIALSPRTSLRIDAFGNLNQYQGLFLSNGDAVPDGKEYGLLFGLNRTLSPLSSVGVTYRPSRFDEGAYGTRNVHRLLANFTYGAADRLQWTFSAGVVSVRVAELSSIPAIAANQKNDNEFSGGIAARGRVGLRGMLTGGIQRDAQAAGGVVGSSVSESAYLAWSQPVARFSSLLVVGRYGRLKPLDVALIGATPIKSRGLRVEYAQSLSAKWFIVAGAEKVKQTSDATEPGILDIDYTVLNLGIRWAPTARLTPTPLM